MKLDYDESGCYGKINVYFNGAYLWSTNRCRTCKVAIERAERHYRYCKITAHWAKK